MPAEDYGTCESFAPVGVRTAASGICRDLQIFIAEMEGREMYQSLLVCAEKHLEGVAGHLVPQARLLRGVESPLRQLVRVLVLHVLVSRLTRSMAV